MTFQRLLATLNDYWEAQGLLITQPYEIEMGAGTMHPDTFLRCLGPEPWNVAYVQPCRRPTDGRYGENPNRFQRYFQHQVIMKPSPDDIQDRYLRSLAALGLDLRQHDVRFEEDDWESPTLGASGVGWQVMLDGMEITQFTYFQQVGGFEVSPVAVEITYGPERLAMYLQGVDDYRELKWSEDITYGELRYQEEVEQSSYNFDEADIKLLLRLFDSYEAECRRLIAGGTETSAGRPLDAARDRPSPFPRATLSPVAGRPMPAYDYVLKCSHTFNLLDARGALSVSERTRFIDRVRRLARGVASLWLAQREELGFPLLKDQPLAAGQ